MFNTYFELASNNNAGASTAFLVAEITFKMAVMTSSEAKIFFVANITFVVVDIAFAVAEITFKVHVIMSSMVKITFVVTELTF